MDYMTLLSGNVRTNAPITPRFTVGSTRDAANVAAYLEREFVKQYADTAAYRKTDITMRVNRAAGI